MSDCETGLRNALKISFPNAVILGWYFHYLKSIVKKVKELGMLNKNILLKTYKLLFFFKVYPFLLPNDKTEFIKYLIENYINELDNNKENFKIIKLIIYFIKNWYGANIINFIDDPDNIFNCRTDNTVERFNLYLNNVINHYHPKLYYFFEKYKTI